MTDAMAVRRARYDAGMTDAQLAEAEGSSSATMRQWRKSRGLKPNGDSKSGQMTDDANAQRLLLYRLGWGDRHIARETGVERVSVREWRKRRSLPANFPSSVHERHHKRPSMSDITRRISRAIGRGLPRDIAEDALADMMVAVLTGEIDLMDIERDARRFGNRVLGNFASKFGPRSIDETVPGTDDLRLVDLLPDESASAWLEEMGATVW